MDCMGLLNEFDATPGSLWKKMECQNASLESDIMKSIGLEKNTS